MTEDISPERTTEQFLYIVKYVRSGFERLASKERLNDVLYQSSRDYAATDIKDWTPAYLSKALLYLSKHLLNPRHTAKILFLFEQNILEIVRYALNSDAAFKTKYIALGTIAKYRPELIEYFLSYFDDKKAVWDEDYVATPKRMRLLEENASDYDVVLSTYHLLRSNLNYFRYKWNWPEFLERNCNEGSNQDFSWLMNEIVALLFGMNEHSKATLHRTTDDDYKEYWHYMTKEIEKQRFYSVASETLDFDEKSSRAYIPLYQQNVKEVTVNVAGVSLPVLKSNHQVIEGCLVETKSTLYNLQRIAIGVSSGRAVCLTGPVGSGKTSLIDHLALLTGRSLSEDVLKVQLGEETDAKLLLGTYKCTEIPGEFVWSPGMLTKAVVMGKWLILEDIGSATSDVAALLANLIQEKNISIPGFKDNVRPTPGFHLFMTQRVINNLPVHQKKDTCSTELLEGHWHRVNLDPLNRDELVLIIKKKYPVLKTIATRMVSVYLLFSQGNHEDGDSVQIRAGSRLISTRDLFKWCRRAVIDFDVSSVDSALKVFQDAIDIFCCSYSSEAQRLELAGEVATCLGIIKTKAEYYCRLYKPSVSLTSTSCVAGRGVIPRKEFEMVSSMKSLTEGMKYALTQSSCCLLERVAVCLSLNEPALLVGETGTGKTTTLQLLAKQTGHKLVVINMNQQSDSSDLLGGFKPVDMKQVIIPIRDEFEKLFRSLFNVEKNMKFLENISVCIAERRWSTLLKLMRESQVAAIKRLSQAQNNSLSEWDDFGRKLEKLRILLKQNTTMSFAFVEGSLVQAMKEGYWVLLDEINLASAETLQCLSGLLEGSDIQLLERGDEGYTSKHKDFRIMAAMNPATDFGKKDLPPGIRNRFTELFVSEHTEKSDLSLLVSVYLPDQPPSRIESIVNFYLLMRKYATEVLSDGSGNRPHYSLRTLCRALVVASENRCGSMARSLYEALCLSFLTQLNSKSHDIVKEKISATVADQTSIKSILSQSIPEPTSKKHIPFEGYWVSKGEYNVHISNKYILTTSVRRNLCDLARVVSLSNHPILVQGETSVGKTSLIVFLAEASGHKVFRINNHQHTDLQEYVGSYCADPNTGNLIFKEGVLAQAMHRGDWVILDELNLAPSEVLEALNRVLDDNRELFIPETNTTIKAHPDFRIFATQNPPGTYGGRKMLSRAFRNRFVELHFGEIPPAELEQILHQRCDMPLAYCKKLLAVMMDLQVHRRGSAAFAGKQGYITLRDLFRWGERYRLASRVNHLSFYDWEQHVAEEGYLVLAGRVRKQEEQEIIKSVIEKRLKRTINLEKLFTLNEDTSLVTKHILEQIVLPPLPKEFTHLVWTRNLRKLAVLVGKALEFKEPILLVGETGCGKTSICQLLAALNKQLLYSVNCHQHSESSDFLGGLRPVRDITENSGKLFEWVDGPLVKAMNTGQMFLVDEISLADDSVLERLNSLLEPERKLLVSEKGSGDEIEIVAKEEFHFISTMNPGGDYGKKELSPALRNRLTEIWCEGPSSEEDLISIIKHNIRTGISFGLHEDGKFGIAKAIIEFTTWFTKNEFGKRISISVRDLLVWVNFINKTFGKEPGKLDVASAYVHGACLTFVDGIGSANTSTDDISALRNFKRVCIKFLLNQLRKSSVDTLQYEGLSDMLESPDTIKLCSGGHFGVFPFLIEEGDEKVLESYEYFSSPTSCGNLIRVLRALQVASRAVLLEGNPGVGKTSLIIELGKISGHKVTRINLSEQTDISDLFGTDIPVESGEGGSFAWSDGPFLKALKAGDWILLDELNLASQSVVEGLNSVLDHRGEIYIPELGRTFTVNAEKTKLFACQNPQRQGGARKGLPQSFLNRFTQVFLEPLTISDHIAVMNELYPDIGSSIREKMVSFHDQICNQTWASPGVWEFNLRDLLRWARTVIMFTKPGIGVEMLYAARMPRAEDRNLILSIYEKIFGSEFPLSSSLSPVLVNPEEVMFGEIRLSRSKDHWGNTDPYSAINEQGRLLILRDQQPILKSLALCVEMYYMVILVGKSGSGKSSMVHLLAQIAGKRLNTIPVSSSMDTTDLLGGFEQADLWRQLDSLTKTTEMLVQEKLRKIALQVPTFDDASKTFKLFTDWANYLKDSTDKTTCGDFAMTTNDSKFRERCKKLEEILKQLPACDKSNSVQKKFANLLKAFEKSGLKAGGVFEWVDSKLIKCVEEGEWLLLDNVNLCSGAVLDRLNSLLEQDGTISIGERGSADHVITPHPGFRIFLTLDPKHGNISRAMRNRGVEIYVEVPDVKTMHPLDLDSLLFNCGLRVAEHRSSLIEIHNKLVALNIGPEQPGLQHLLEVANISSQNWKQGFPLSESILNALADVYVKSRSLTQSQKNTLLNELNSVLLEYKHVFSDNKLKPVDMFWPEYTTLTSVSLQLESIPSVARQHGALLNSIMKNYERAQIVKNWPTTFTLKDIVSSDVLKLPVKHINMNMEVRDILPYLISSFYSCAAYHDVKARQFFIDTAVTEGFSYHPDTKIRKVFNTIDQYSQLISGYLTTIPESYEPWDRRHMAITLENKIWSRENSLIALIYYRLVSDMSHSEKDSFLLANDQWLISALEYSEAVTRGRVPEFEHVLIHELYNLMKSFDRIVISTLKNNLRKNTDTLELPNDVCAELIYQYAWKFRLLTTAERRMFTTGKVKGTLPPPCANTISLIELHYDWFRKHTIPVVMKLIESQNKTRGIVEEFKLLLNKIDLSLDFNSIHMVPIARKFRKLLALPVPMSTCFRYTSLKKIYGFEVDIDLWSNDFKLIPKVNFLASAKGQQTRTKFIQAFVLLQEGKEEVFLDLLLKEIETNVKCISFEEQSECGLNELNTIKLWPLLELICHKLSTAARRVIMSGERTSLDSQLTDSLCSWLDLTGTVSPVVAATARHTFNKLSTSHVNLNVQIMHLLFDYMRTSPSLKFPLALLNWEDVSDPEKHIKLFENKASYISHYPLVSLFLSKLYVNISSQHDTPSFAIKSHKNINKLFQLIKLLLWRNLPAMYSDVLSSRINEEICLERSFEYFYKSLKLAINAKHKNAITSENPLDILREVSKLLSAISNQEGGIPLCQSIAAHESGLVTSLSETYQILHELKQTESENDIDKWLLIGEGWTHIGRAHFLLFSSLDRIDPFHKRNIKLLYNQQEIKELQMLLCVEELSKVLIGAPLTWPLKEEHEKHIEILKAKNNALKKTVVVRPEIPSYNELIQDVTLVTNALVSNEVLGPRMSNLISLPGSSKTVEEIDVVFNETRNWLTSLDRTISKLYKTYVVALPDIITPILLALSQISFGMKLVLSSIAKKTLQKSYRGRISIEKYMKMLIAYPLCDLETALEISSACSTSEIMSFLNKCSNEPQSQQEYKIKLIKICLRIVKSVSKTSAMCSASNTFFQVLDHVVLCWHQIQEEEIIKKAQEDSIYINRMKLTEEELLEREKQVLFPSTREKDFGDLEAPDTLEGVGSRDKDKDMKNDPLRLSVEEIAEICLIHSEIVRGTAAAHWIPHSNETDESPILLLKDRFALYSVLISQNYSSVGDQLDRDSIAALLLTSSLSSQPDSVRSPQKHYDFYRDSNLAESKQCIPLLNAIQGKVNELLHEWPDHPTLNQILIIIDRVTGFSMGSPLSRFLVGLELLLAKLHQWEENAHSGVSLAQHSTSLTQQIINWRKLELSAWKGALHSTFLKVEANGRKWWFHIYALVTSFIRNTSPETLEDETEDLVKSLQALMEKSTLGEYSARLELLYTFHCHALILPSSHRQSIISSILWNLYCFYKLFTDAITKVINELTVPIEKKLKDFVKIARWNDINYWSVKSAVDKTHQTLLKFIKEYEKILNEPARGAMIKVEISKSISSKLNLSSIKETRFLTTCTLPDSYKDLEASERLFSRLNLLLKKSRSLSSSIIKFCPYPKLLDNLEILIEEIEETGNLINEFDVDASLPKEKRKSVVKSLLQRKRKAISDLFKTLSQIGLSYRSGLIMFEQKNIAFTKLLPVDVKAALDLIESRKSDSTWLNSWKGTEHYFYASVAKIAMLKIALEKPHKDLGPQFIDRIKGFTAHSNDILYNLKEKFTESTLSLYVIRCQLLQFLNMTKDDYGIINSNFTKNKNILKNVAENIVYCLKQFIYIIDACPEQEVNLSNNQIVPLIFPDNSKLGMVTAFKYDPIWESLKAKVEMIINSSSGILRQISSLEKSSSFTTIVGSTKKNIDTVIIAKAFSIVENGFELLRKTYSDIEDVEKRFQQSVGDKVFTNPLTACLENIKKHIDKALHSHIDVEYPPKPKFNSFTEIISAVPSNIADKLEAFLNKALCIIQNIYKNHIQEDTSKNAAEEQANDGIPSSEEEKEIIVDGHLKEKLVESVFKDLNLLRISEISDDLQTICNDLTEMENCLDSSLEACQGLIYHIIPILDQLVSVYHYFIIQLTSSVKILGKFSTSLSTVFIDFAKNGYKIPEELMEEVEGEGESQKGGLGLGEGEGEKDVSDQIESEDQLEDARKPGDYGKDEEKDCKEEEKGIEMSEDFEAKHQDIEKKEGDEEKSDEEEENDKDLDKEMGETEKEADTLDKQIWGSDSEEEEDENEELPKDEKGSKGEQQSEKELGAKDEDDKTEVGDKEDSKKKEPKEKEINEMEEPEVDDDHIDPYHGKQQPSPEVEPLELEDEDMELDNDEDKASDKDEEENPFDIDTMKKKFEEEKPPEEAPGEEQDETKDKDEEEDKNEEIDDEPTPEVKKPEGDDTDKEDENVEEGSNEDAKGETLEEEDEKIGNEEAGGTDEQPAPLPSESSNKQEGSKDQVKNDEEMDVESDTKPEETKAEGKEHSGSGKAENVNIDSGGHKGETGKRKNIGDLEKDERRPKPGQSEVERSLGETNEPVAKKLKTIGIQEQTNEEKDETGNEEKIEEDTEADLYQHIREAKENQYDAQTVDAATQEQAEKQPPPTIGKEDEKDEGMDVDEIAHLDEDDMEVDVEKAKQQESSILEEGGKKDESKKDKGEAGGPLEEARVEVEGEYIETASVPRGSESTFHTQISETVGEPLSETDVINLRQQLQEQLASWKQPPDTSEAAAAWEKVCNVTRSLAQQLSEELRLVLEPTTASSLRGDFRTGKRINMRKVIPYIASQFRKDKIWLRRTKPSKREYQIIMAIDDSSSMADNKAKELAFESLAVVSKALNLIEAGELAVISFGEKVRVLHQLGESFTENSGARLIQEFSFGQTHTRVGAAVETALGLVSMRGRDSAQLLVIISDGRGVMSEGEQAVRSMVRKANHARLFIVFIVVDSPTSKDSILDIRLPVFSGGKLVEIKSYMDNFPFPFYLILRDIANLPSVLSDALRQWFELVTDTQ